MEGDVVRKHGTDGEQSGKIIQDATEKQVSYSVEGFLNLLDLKEYLPNFVNNNIHNLNDVDETLLINIGIDKVGHRKRFLRELDIVQGRSDSKMEQFDDNNVEDVPPPLPPKMKSTRSGSPNMHPPIPQPRTISPSPSPTSIEPSPNQAASLPQKPARPAKPPRTTIARPITTYLPPGDTIIPPCPKTKPPVPPRDEEAFKAHQKRSSPVMTKLKRDSRARSMDLLSSFDDDDLSMLPKSSLSLSRNQRSDLNRNSMSSFGKVETTNENDASGVQKETRKREDNQGLSNSVTAARSNSSNLVFSENDPFSPGDSAENTKGYQPPPLSEQLLGNISDNTATIQPVTTENKSNGGSVRFDSLISVGSSIGRFTSTDDELESPTTADPCDSADNLSDDEDDDEDYQNALCVDGNTAAGPELLSCRASKEEFLDNLRQQAQQKQEISRQGGEEIRRSVSQNRKSRFFTQKKSGYLMMRSNHQSIKAIKGKRWVEFTGTEVKIFKERGGILKVTIPGSKIYDVIWDKSAKKPTFHIEMNSKSDPQKVKRYTFTEPDGNLDNMTIWVQVIMEARMDALSEASLEGSGESPSGSTSGNGPSGPMANPDMEGYLNKEGHNIIHDQKQRYVVIKENKLCYYDSKEDFFNDESHLSCLEMASVSLKTEDDKLRLILHTHTQRTYNFTASDVPEFIKWKEAIETSIQYGIGDDKIKNQFQENESNKKCADCGENNPIYASINLLVVTCSKCIGLHRLLGAHISKARSLLMDTNVWTPTLLSLFQTIGNARANQLWEHNLPSTERIYPNATKEQRKTFIFDKYKDRKYFNWSPDFGKPDELGMTLRNVVITDNVLETLQLLISEVDVHYVPEGSLDQRTPYQLAKDAGQDAQVEMLFHFNGHLSRSEMRELELIRIANQHTSGELLISTSRSDTAKEHQCTLNHKKIEMKRLDKIDELEIIDLTKLEEMEIDKDDSTMVVLKLNDKSFFLKAPSLEAANTWFLAIKNKQAFGVSLEKQERNPSKIPFTVAECISFMEQNALTTGGIYRQNGSQLTIKKLVLLFNQDARNLCLSFDEYPDIHAVAGTIKLFFRQLPEPLLTKSLYLDWIQNAEETTTVDGHNQKLYRYKFLLEELPPFNYTTLRFLILHLSQVIALSHYNKMQLENITLIFGPILANCGNSTDEAWLKREYNILHDMLTYYVWLFEVSDTEVKVIEGITNFHIKQQQQQQPQCANTMVTIYFEDFEDQMKMNSATRSNDVCLFCMARHHLSPNENWGLFEVLFEYGRDNETLVESGIERLVHVSEPILDLAAKVGSKRRLVVKSNYVIDLMIAHRSRTLCIKGHLNFNKGDKWKKLCFVEVKTGTIRVYKKEGDTKEEDNISIHETEIYIGNCNKKKAIAQYGFAVEKRDGEFRYFCSDNEVEINEFIANILMIRHPSGMWSPILDKSNQLGLDEANVDPLWGRQSTVVRPSGTSNRLRNQLDKKRQTLRNIFK